MNEREATQFVGKDVTVKRGANYDDLYVVGLITRPSLIFENAYGHRFVHALDDIDDMTRRADGPKSD